MICGRCGGKNLSKEKCPECGTLPGCHLTSDVKQDVSVIAPKLESLHIPSAYLGKRWNVDMFWASHQDKKANKLVNIYVSQLELVQNIFAGGGIPDRSAMFLAPAGYSKMIWAYSCMQYAITHGYSVAPILDTMELKRVLVLAAEKPKQSVMGMNYDEFINSDVLFFTVTKTEYRRNASDVIADLLDKRARRGKGSIGLSRVSVLEMAQWDSTNSFLAWRNPEIPIDLFKMPAIVSCL